MMAGPNFRMVPSGPAPDGWRVATCEEVQASIATVRQLFGHGQQWNICKLKDGKISGPGYQYKIEPGHVTKQEVGHMIVIEKGGHAKAQVHVPAGGAHGGQRRHQAMQFQIAASGAPPFGWRMASCHEVADNMQQVKELLRPHQWHICALADGSISGPGHQYSLKQGPPDQVLGHMLITKPK